MITQVILIIIGLLMLISSLYDMLAPREDNLFSDRGSENPSGFMLFIGALLVLAGILGIRKYHQQNNRRRY